MRKKLTAILMLICMLAVYLPAGAFAAEDCARVEYTGTEASLTNVTSARAGASNVLEAVEAGGVSAVKLLAVSNVLSSCITVDIAGNYMRDLKSGEGVDVSVEYFDAESGSFVLKYDARTNSAKETEIVYMGGTNTWKTHTFHLYDAKFANRCSNADIMLALYSERSGIPKSDVILKSIEITPADRYFPIDLAENGPVGNLFVKGENAALKLTAKNILSESVTAQYRAEITDAYGVKDTEKSGTITFEPGENEITLAMPGDKCGTFDAKLIFTGDNNLYGEYKTNYSITVNASSSNKDFGMNTHYRIEDRDPKISLPLVQNTGAGMIRDEFTWGMCEKTKGTVEIPERLMNYVDTANAAGIEVLGLLSGGNSFYDDGKFPQSDTALEAYGNYVYNVVAALKGKVEIFQIWNEFHHTWNNLSPDYATNPNKVINDRSWTQKGAEAYVKLLKVAYENAKSANPQCKIVGLSGAPGVWSYWVDYMLRAGAAEYMDVMSLHEYDAYNAPEKKMLTWIANVKNYAEKNGAGDMPIWITETGWASSDVSVLEQAKYGVRQYLMYKNAGIDKYFWYDFKCDGFNRKYDQNSFGVIYNNAEPESVPYSAKPAYAALSNLNDKVGNAEIESYTDGTDGTQIYKMKRADGRYFWVLWNTKADITASVDIGETEAEVFDMFGTMTRKSSSDGVYELAVSDEPIYITKKGYDTVTGVSEINYRTGEISVTVAGLNPENSVTIMVLRPDKTPADVYEQGFDAVCHMEEVRGKGTSYDFSFTADEEGDYEIYINTGTRMIKLGAAFYTPLGAEVSVWQGEKRITEFSQIDKTKPLIVKASIDNTYGKSGDYILLCGVYKGEVLVKAESESGLLTDGVNTPSTEISGISDYDEVKVFLWKDKTRLIPMTENCDLKSAK